MRYPHALAAFLVATVLLSACTFGASPAVPTGPTGEPVAPTTSSVGVGPTAAESDSSASAATGGRVTITFAASEDFRSVYEPLIARFEAENPEIHVQLVDLDTLLTPVVLPNGSTMTTTEGAMRAIMSGADTAAVGPDTEAIAKGWVRDLKPLMDADATFDRADFYPGTLEAATQDGHLFMLPHTRYVELLSYNKDLWAARGLPAPKPDWTWDDLKAAAEQLVQRRGTTIEMYGMVDWEDGYPALDAELPASGMQPDLSAPIRLDAPEVVAALERVAEMARSGTLYIPTGDNGPRVEELIRAQRIGIWAATPNMLPPGGPQPAFAIGTVARPSAPASVDGYTMSSGTLHPVEAWRWLAFLSREGATESFWNSNVAGQVPARRSVAERTGYWKRLDAETTATVQAALARPALMPSQAAPGFAHAFGLLHQALAEVVRGERTAREALSAAQTALERQLAQEPPTPTPATERIVVATPQPEAPAEATRITFGTLRPLVEPLRQAARAFTRRNPAIAIEVKNIESSSGATPPLADLANQVDCFSWFGPPAPADTPALLDLQPLIDADPGFALEDYPDALLAPFRRGTALYGLPYAVELRVLNYNPAAFDAAGLAYPRDGWTIDDFANAARQLTGEAGVGRRYGLASTALPAQDVLFFLDRLGAPPTSGSGAALQPAFADERVVRALRVYLDLLRDSSPHDHLRGYTRGDWRDDALQLVAAGRVGMWFDFGAHFFRLGTPEYQGFTPAIAPPPLGARGVSGADFYARGMYISARARQPDACWAWLKALSADLSILEGGFPARRSLAESEAFAAQAAPGAAAVYRAYRAGFDRASASPEAGGRSAIDYYWFFRAIDRALGGADLERELTGAQALTVQYLACVEGGAKPGDCAVQVDPEYQGWNGARGSR